MNVQFWSAVSVIVIVVPAAILMVWGWRRRVRRQQHAIAPLPEIPAVLPATAAQRGKYVATTVAGDPYDRIAVRGLAFRGFATVSVDASGILIARDGEAAIWIDAARVVGIDRATWTIDRVVEGSGLHLMRWRHGDREVDTYLRLDEPGALDADLRAAGMPLAPLPFPPSATERRRAAKRARREASTA
ncbi:MAG TPA: hypothetical protein VNR37_07045 [Microbacteriaceae bacterium]|nr:hypothetical protein [Microbacteriaceae bacterium]